MRKFKIILLLIAFIISLAAWLVAGQLIAPEPGKVAIPKTSLPIENVTIKSKSGSKLAAWHIKANTNKGVVALFHGIRANRLSMFERAKLLYANGYSVVSIDFQAQGESPGENITIGYLEKHDVLATINFAKTQHPNQPIGVIGGSLGGASTLLALPKNIDALVIESVYSDIETAVHNRVKARLGFLSWAPAKILLTQLKPRLGFNVSELSPISKVSALNCPILVISGTADEHTTVSETKKIFERAKEPKQLWLVEGLAHQDIYKARPAAYEEKVLGFLNRYMNQ